MNYFIRYGGDLSTSEKFVFSNFTYYSTIVSSESLKGSLTSFENTKWSRKCLSKLTC